jgi:hypothetical protein
METSLQGQLERAADKKVETMGRVRRNKSNAELRTEQNIFFLGLRGDIISKEEGILLNHVETYVEKHENEFVPPQLLDLLFCLPCDLKHEVRD